MYRGTRAGNLFTSLSNLQSVLQILVMYLTYLMASIVLLETLPMQLAASRCITSVVSGRRSSDCDASVVSLSAGWKNKSCTQSIELAAFCSSCHQTWKETARISVYCVIIVYTICIFLTSSKMSSSVCFIPVCKIEMLMKMTMFE